MAICQLPTIRLTLCLAIVILCALGGPQVIAQGTDFRDNFDGDGLGPLDLVAIWRATNSYDLVVATGGVPPSTQIASYTGTSSTPQVFFLPTDSSSNALHWPTARPFRRFVRVQFDAAVDGAGTTKPITYLHIIFTPRESSWGIGVEQGPEIDVELKCNLNTLDSQFIVMAQVNSSSSASLPAYDVSDTGFRSGNFVPDFTAGAFKTYAIDFAWDLYPVPPQSSGVTSWENALKLFAVRIQILYNNAWVPAVDPVQLAGWGFLVNTGTAPTPLAGLDTTAWGLKSPTEPKDAFVHFEADNGAPGTATWSIDNVSIVSQPVPSFSVMSSTVAYDTVGPQRAFLRANTPDSNDPNRLSIGSSTAVIQDALGNTVANCTIGPPVQAFEGLDDEVDVNRNSDSIDDSNPYPIWWWPITNWQPPITSPRSSLHVHASLSVFGGSGETVDGPAFDIAEEGPYSALWHGLSIDNGGQRVYTAGVGGGWSDCSNSTGENRSHGHFVSAMSRLLSSRWSEMTTSDADALVGQIKVGLDYLLQLEDPNVTGSWSHSSSGNGPQHPVKNGSTVLRGHVWWEHQARAVHQDGKNLPERILIAGEGLYDGAAALRQVGDPGFNALLNVSYLDIAEYVHTYIDKSVPNAPNNPSALVTATLDVAAAAATADPNNVHRAQANMRSVLGDDPPDESQNTLLRWTLGTDSGSTLPWTPVKALTWLDTYAPYLPDSILARDGLEQIRELSQYAQADSTSYPNVLNIPRFWKTDFTHLNYRGTSNFTNQPVATTCDDTSLLAQALGREPRMADLATGGVEWLLGINFGMRGRGTTLTSSNLNSADLETAAASFVLHVGSVSALTSFGPADWLEPTTTNGFNGPCWSYDPRLQESETYIKTDATLLTAVESYGRLLHPVFVIQAEDFSSSLGTLTVFANNFDPVSNTYHANGGESIQDSSSAPVNVTYNVTIPPNLTGVYRILIRASNNSAANQPITVKIDNATVGVASIAGTGGTYLNTVTEVSSTVALGVSIHTLELDFSGVDLAIDAVTLKAVSLN